MSTRLLAWSSCLRARFSGRARVRFSWSLRPVLDDLGALVPQFVGDLLAVIAVDDLPHRAVSTSTKIGTRTPLRAMLDRNPIVLVGG